MKGNRQLAWVDKIGQSRYIQPLGDEKMAAVRMSRGIEQSKYVQAIGKERELALRID
jgi:hypothetical protein